MQLFLNPTTDLHHVFKPPTTLLTHSISSAPDFFRRAKPRIFLFFFAAVRLCTEHGSLGRVGLARGFYFQSSRFKKVGNLKKAFPIHGPAKVRCFDGCCLSGWWLDAVLLDCYCWHGGLWLLVAGGVIGFGIICFCGVIRFGLAVARGQYGCNIACFGAYCWCLYVRQVLSGFKWAVNRLAHGVISRPFTVCTKLG